MTTATHTNEELATNKDVEASFDTLMAQLNIANALLNDILVRLIKLEEGQRQIIDILKRIERQTSRKTGC